MTTYKVELVLQLSISKKDIPDPELLIESSLQNTLMDWATEHNADLTFEKSKLTKVKEGGK